jgi:hypothetical protein
MADYFKRILELVKELKNGNNNLSGCSFEACSLAACPFASGKAANSVTPVEI